MPERRSAIWSKPSTPEFPAPPSPSAAPIASTPAIKPALVGGALQIVDLQGNNDLAVAETVHTVVSSGAPFTANAAATSTVQDLINAINADATVGAKAALVNGNSKSPIRRTAANLAVTTNDTVLGAAVAGAPTAFTTPNVSTGQTPTEYYSNIVFAVGNDVSNATAELSSSQLVLQQLQDQRGSLSGR